MLKYLSAVGEGILTLSSWPYRPPDLWPFSQTVQSVCFTEDLEAWNSQDIIVYNLRIILLLFSRQLKISKSSQAHLAFYERSLGKMTSKLSQQLIQRLITFPVSFSCTWNWISVTIKTHFSLASLLGHNINLQSIIIDYLADRFQKQQ